MRKFKLSVFALLLLIFTACKIDGPDAPADYNQPGKIMFDLSNRNLNFYSNLLDKALKINTYINSPDSLKQQMEDKYLMDFKIRTKNNKDYFLLISGDTIYAINTNNQNLNDPGSCFSINRVHFDTITIANTGKNNWSINESNVGLLYRNFFTSLNFYCADQTMPESFESGNFEITGSFSFVAWRLYPNTLFEFSITEKFIHNANTKFHIFQKGACEISGQNKNSTESETTQANFELLNNQLDIEIIYKLRTKIYNEGYPEVNYDKDEYMWIYNY